MISVSGDKILYTWKDIDTAVSSIVSELKYEPELIVGIARGGLVPAVMFSHALNIPLEVLYWSTRDFQQSRLDQLKFLAGLNKKILLVDDLVDSGKTIIQIKEAITKLDLDLDYKVAALINNVGQTKVIPDYYHDIIDRRVDERWIIFAYERE